MAQGKVVQVIGTVVDVEFPPDGLPRIFNALEIDREDGKIMLEVQEHVGNNRVRCLSFSPTEGLSRGAAVSDTGRPLSVPVGRATLGRLFNVLGEPIDGKGDVGATESWPIHRTPPSIEDQNTETEILETGLKVIDLIAPFTKGVKSAPTAEPVSARR
jgi:F-type H+-transporting ATPase subunit beta